MAREPADSKPMRVGLFVTCLVDAFRPSVGFAAIKLLEDAGCDFDVPLQQTCCGQPALNSGARHHARELAKTVIDAFLPYDYVVAPSGSCTGTIKVHYRSLLADDPAWVEKCDRLATKTFEILSFLRDVVDYTPKDTAYQGVATYHDTCSGLRELGIHAQPRALLAQVRGLTMVPLEKSEVCCGFGGLFCVKYPEISNAMVTEKARFVEQTGADTLLGGDLGCLMNIAGKLSRLGTSVKVYHAAEVLAGAADTAPLCRKV